MSNEGYINLNSMESIKNVIDLDFDFFYFDRLIFDLSSKLVNDDVLYKKFTSKLQSKGFNILFKGFTSNSFFGLPNNIIRLLIVCSKNRTNFSLNNDINMISIPHNHIAPMALLYGKKLNKLENQYYKIAANLNIPEHIVANDFEKYLIFSEHGVHDNVFQKLGIKGNLDRKKFSDGSNQRPSNSKKIRDTINNADRIHMLYPVDDNTSKYYYHFNPNRTTCTVREIARINGYPDSYDLSDYSVDDFILKVNSCLSPFVINNLFDIL